MTPKTKETMSPRRTVYFLPSLLDIRPLTTVPSRTPPVGMTTSSSTLASEMLEKYCFINGIVPETALETDIRNDMDKMPSIKIGELVFTCCSFDSMKVPSSELSSHGLRDGERLIHSCTANN